eukprot:TRINITY_DN30342_c0_g1_i1.p1 TRINITY_DN30342_c0_g1~~TRINITY_DN30342_c0_g1_i1.p1  ORF type:complete len:99 (-),score=29.10 TRINITY_DN30342_c0_g1_i1:60-326(-)
MKIPQHYIALSPLFAAVGAGVLFSAYYGIRTLTTHNDVTWFKSKDNSFHYENQERSKLFPRDRAIDHFHKLNRNETKNKDEVETKKKY